MPEVAVRIDHSPATVEWQTSRYRPYVLGIGPISRGPQRLVVDVPRSPSPLIPRILIALVALTAALAVPYFLFGLALRQSLPMRWLIVPFAGMVAYATVLLARERPWSRVETIEIDSRFVSLSRHGRMITLLPRGMALEVATPFDDRYRIPAGLSGYAILLGTAGNWHLLAGEGMPQATAIEVVSQIRAFMDNHPVESGFRVDTTAAPVG